MLCLTALKTQSIHQLCQATYQVPRPQGIIAQKVWVSLLMCWMELSFHLSLQVRNMSEFSYYSFFFFFWMWGSYFIKSSLYLLLDFSSGHLCTLSFQNTINQGRFQADYLKGEQVNKSWVFLTNPLLEKSYIISNSILNPLT